MSVQPDNYYQYHAGRAAARDDYAHEYANGYFIQRMRDIEAEEVAAILGGALEDHEKDADQLLYRIRNVNSYHDFEGLDEMGRLFANIVTTTVYKQLYDEGGKLFDEQNPARFIE